MSLEYELKCTLSEQNFFNIRQCIFVLDIIVRFFDAYKERGQVFV